MAELDGAVATAAQRTHAARDFWPGSGLYVPGSQKTHGAPGVGLYVPAGHASHAPVVPSNAAPAGHDSHPLRSGEGTVPAPHGVQLSAPTTPAVELCVLSPHSSQKVAESAPLCPAAMYRPAAHSVHEAEAGDELYVPGEHGSHCAAPSWAWC